MKNIHRLRARKFLTEQQMLTAARFYKNPQNFSRISPTLFRILREIIIDEVPLEVMEERRGWPARSAKCLVSVLLFALEESDGIFWSDMEDPQADVRAALEYLVDGDGTEISELQHAFGLTLNEAKVFRLLLIKMGEPVTKERGQAHENA